VTQLQSWFMIICSLKRIRKVKGPDIYIPPLTGKPDQQRIIIEVEYRRALALGGAAQLAAAHSPNEGLWTRSLQLDLCPSQPHYGLHPAMFSGKDSLFLVASVSRY